MTTVTLPREVVQELLSWNAVEITPSMYTALRAALDAPAKPVDCRGCMHLKEKVVSRSVDAFVAEFKTITRCDGPEVCTDFDKFQALPPIRLTTITKVTK